MNSETLLHPGPVYIIFGLNYCNEKRNFSLMDEKEKEKSYIQSPQG